MCVPGPPLAWWENSWESQLWLAPQGILHPLLSSTQAEPVRNWLLHRSLSTRAGLREGWRGGAQVLRVKLLAASPQNNFFPPGTWGYGAPLLGGVTGQKTQTWGWEWSTIGLLEDRLAVPLKNGQPAKRKHGFLGPTPSALPLAQQKKRVYEEAETFFVCFNFKKKSQFSLKLYS